MNFTTDQTKRILTWYWTMISMTRLGEVPHLYHCCLCLIFDQKKRDCMERLVTPPRRGTSPTWGPPPPCEQALTRFVSFVLNKHEGPEPKAEPLRHDRSFQLTALTAWNEHTAPKEIAGREKIYIDGKKASLSKVNLSACTCIKYEIFRIQLFRA